MKIKVEIEIKNIESWNSYEILNSENKEEIEKELRNLEKDIESELTRSLLDYNSLTVKCGLF